MRFLGLLLGSVFAFEPVAVADLPLVLTATPDVQWTAASVWPEFAGGGAAFVVDVRLNPVVQDGGNDQAGVGITLGLDSTTASAHPRDATEGQGVVGVVLKEMADRGEWHFLIDGRDVSVDPPNKGVTDNRELQRPNVFSTHPGDYRVVFVGTPHEAGTRLRMYFEHLDRPVEDHVIARRLEPKHIGFFADLDHKATEPATLQVNSIRIRVGERAAVEVEQSPVEALLAAVDWSHESVAPYREAYDSGRHKDAASGLIKHLRNRTTPPGAELVEMYYGVNFREIADEALKGRYGTMGHGAAFSNKFADDKGMPRWELDSGYLNRHFHWCSLAKAYDQTGHEDYARRFAAEVSSWVDNEPFYVPNTPYIPGIDWMDGTVFRVGYMNTSNIGRRCEMTWWPAYEVFRRAESFDDEAHGRMLLGFIRQARLLSNPTSFAWWDDGGAHGTLALLQTALMLPEFKESAAWRRIAKERLQIVIDKQFYPDGSHVSLSSGYNFATIHALENVVRLYRRFGIDADFVSAPLLKAYRHPIALARPVKRGQVDLNDGGWSAVDDHLAFGGELLPDDEPLKWFATSGRDGSPETVGSTYFTNAGHAIMRTGWGERDRYLLFDAGPVGASHGKEDKLAITLDVGGQVLLGNGGRAGYNEPALLRYTGSIYAQNTLNVDRLDQARIARRQEIYGWVPEKRRWVSNDVFDYVEGFHTDGWYSASTAVQGKHTRQVVCIKGSNPPESTYFLVVDSVLFADDQPHACEVMWHSRLDHLKVNSRSNQVDAWDARGAVRILPLDEAGLVTQSIVGQTEPRMIGWEVYGSAKKPSATAMQRWTTRGSSTKAWLLIPSAAGEERCVELTEQGEAHRTGRTLHTHVFRRDGGVDEIRCEIANEGKTSPNIVILCKDTQGTATASFDLSDVDHP